jgi:hypothetical protein
MITLHWELKLYWGLTPQAALTVSWIPEEAEPIVDPAGYE